MSTAAITQLDTRAGSLNGEAITSANGNITGSRFELGSEGCAKNIKAQLKARGYKGRDLSKRVNSVLRGESDIRSQLAAAFVTAASQQGYVPDVAELRKSTGVLRFIKPSEPKAKKVKVTPADVKAMSAEERQELLDALMGE